MIPKSFSTPCHFSICPQAKQTRLPLISSSISSTAVFDLIHCDILGGYHTPSISGARYFLTLVDDFTRCTRICLMNGKSKTMQLLKAFFVIVFFFFFLNKR